MKSLICTMAIILGSVSLAGAVPCDGSTAKANCPHATKAKANCSAKCAKAEKTGAEKAQKKAKCNTSPEATRNTAVATKAFMASYETKHCTKSATQAAYQAVLKKTGCTMSANAAATEAARKYAYDAELAKSSCSKSAKAAAEEAGKQAHTTLSNMSPQEAPPEAG